jgi:hypothetical protein
LFDGVPDKLRPRRLLLIGQRIQSFHQLFIGFERDYLHVTPSKGITQFSYCITHRARAQGSSGEMNRENRLGWF